jgi:glycosyltransferase involved in cell wall biosynthesis
MSGEMRAPDPIRVLALIDSLGTGGAEFLLGDFAARAPDGGIDLSVAYLHARGDHGLRRLRAGGVEAVHVPVTSLVGPGGLWRIRRHLATVRPEILHTHLGTSDFLGGLAARSLRLPAVSTVHVMEWPRDRRNDVKVQLISAARRACMARVIAVSEPAGRWMLEHRWARPRQLVTVHNGVAGVPRPGAGRPVRRALGIAEDALVVAMLSVIREGKGHDVAIAAVARRRARVPGRELVVGGDGEGRARLEALTARDAGVTFAGHREDVMEVLDAADVLLHPSRIDAFPGALLEAMAAGVPVVASAVGGIPDIVDHGGTGVLVSPPLTSAVVADALAPLLADAGLRVELARRGRERFERRFSAERWLERTRAVYESVLADARSLH